MHLIVFNWESSINIGAEKWYKYSTIIVEDYNGGWQLGSYYSILYYCVLQETAYVFCIITFLWVHMFYFFHSLGTAYWITRYSNFDGIQFIYIFDFMYLWPMCHSKKLYLIHSHTDSVSICSPRESFPDDYLLGI